MTSEKAIRTMVKPVSIPETTSWESSADRLRKPKLPGTRSSIPGSMATADGNRSRLADKWPTEPTSQAPSSTPSWGPRASLPSREPKNDSTAATGHSITGAQWNVQGT